MPKRAKGLTARLVPTLPAGMHADGGGLYLQVAKSGGRTWIYRFQLAYRRRDMGLGSAETFSITEARAKAEAARKLVAEGIDPIERRELQQSEKHVVAATSLSFRAAAETYVEAHRAAWRSDKHAAQWTSTLETYAHPVMGTLPIHAINTGLVLKVLEPIWSQKIETASRLRGRIENVLDWAKARGYRDGENPARWKGHLDHVLPSPAKVRRVEHHASMPYADIPDFWPALQGTDGMGARALELVILTASRSAEALGALWGEIDIDKAIWTIPGARMKAGQEHRVPLSEPAIALLRKMWAVRQGAYVFSGQRKDRPLSNMAMAMVLRRMALEVTVHGYRSTFRTWAAECTAAPAEVCEAALAHMPASKIVAAYQRGDLFERRRRLMADWAGYVTTPKSGAVLLPIRHSN